MLPWPCRAYVAGVDAGFVTREAARERVLVTARFFANAPQGPAYLGTAGHQGFFYHFLDMQTGHRINGKVELSSIDTALLIAGLLCAQSYFDRDDAGEAEIRRLVDHIYGRVNWPWMQQRGELICMGWDPRTGFKRFIDYKGYDEAMILYLLALGSPTHPVGPGAWAQFTATYSRTWGSFMGQLYLGGAPHFFHQYTHVWVDFRGIQDEFMRTHGLDYFENSRRATLAQQAYGNISITGRAARASKTPPTTAPLRPPPHWAACLLRPSSCCRHCATCVSASVRRFTAATALSIRSTPASGA